MISFMAIDLWQEIPKKFKDLNQFAFSKCVNNYICSISAISNVIFHNSKSVKTMFYVSNNKRNFPQFSSSFL